MKVFVRGKPSLPVSAAPVELVALWFWLSLDFPGGSGGEESACNARDL